MTYWVLTRRSRKCCQEKDICYILGFINTHDMARHITCKESVEFYVLFRKSLFQGTSLISQQINARA